MKNLLNLKTRTYYTVFIISVFLAVWFLTGDLISFIFPDLNGYLRWGTVLGLEISICIAAVMIISRKNLLGAIDELGMMASIPAGFIASLAATLPLPVIFLVTGPMNSDLDGIRLLFTSFLAPLGEEIVFRGFAFWMLYKYVRLGFWASVLLPTFVFGFAHLPQANDMMSALGIFGITAIGSIWFSWLLMRWENLWVPIFIHALMNGWWEIFDVDDTALGGYMANIARLLVIGISIVLTLYKESLTSRFFRTKKSTDKNVIE